MKSTTANRVITSTLGILVGLTCIEHGGEAAVTVVPSFLVTGILAVLGGLGVTAWSAAYVQ